VGKRTSVLVMRHCVRSTAEDGIFAVKGLHYYNNYSARPWPPFHVPVMYCLPRGVQIVEGTGRWFKEHGDLPEPVHVTSDYSQRDLDTSRAFLTGLGWADASNFAVDGSMFATNYSEACPEFQPWEKALAKGKQLAAFPMPKNFVDLHTALFSTMGQGAAGDWTGVPCHASNHSGYLIGGCAAASEFAERLLMESGGAMRVGWGKLSEEDVQELLQLHAWFRQVDEGTPELIFRSQAGISRAVLAVLDAEAEGTEIFVGHDTQLNALNAALGLSWEPTPFPINATLPGSALRFDRQGDTVEISYVYPSSVSDSTGAMSSVPAGPGKLSIAEMRALVEKGSDGACSPPFRSSLLRPKNGGIVV